MRALLDTHAFIWWATDDPLLTDTVREIISNPENEIFLSAVSTWEMAIKIAIGKMTLALPLEEFVSSQLTQCRFAPLRVTYDHTYRVSSLPHHHRDPFDRLLIAQAITENLVLLSADAQFTPYGVAILW